MPGGSSPQSQAAAAELTQQDSDEKNPWLKAKPVQRKITVQTLSSKIVMPEMPAMDMMDFSKINDRMDLNKAPKMASSQPMGMGGAGGDLVLALELAASSVSWVRPPSGAGWCLWWMSRAPCRSR